MGATIDGIEVWTAAECAEAAGCTQSTWRAYVGREQAPKPLDKKIGRSNVWSADEVRAWAASRPGRGARTDLRD